MSDQNSLINLGELSKPATVLIDRIFDAARGYFRPKQIIRVAKAEEAAEMIRVLGEIDRTQQRQRALSRFVAEETRKQEIIEQITAKAIPEVGDAAKPEDIEEDWLANFFDKCRLTSDENMQALWARILAGEANAPGKYSRRTINLLADLDKSDAEMFTNLCSFAFFIGPLIPLIYDVKHEIYRKNGVSFDTLTNLASIGLIRYDSVGGHSRLGLRKSRHYSYYGTPVWMEFKSPPPHDLKIGHVILTEVGQQLASLTRATPREGFIEYVREQWRGFGYIVEESEESDEEPEGAPEATEE